MRGTRQRLVSFLAVHQDPQYLDEARKVGVYISPVSANEMIGSIEKMARASPELFEQVRKLLAGNKGG